MFIKATTYFARKTTLTREYGEARWQAFQTKLAEQVPFFRNPVFSTTRIPHEAFIPFCDLLLEEFYGGDPEAYKRIGEAAAKWALVEGPYKALLEGRNARHFILASAPALWSTYYSEEQGTLSTAIEGQTVHFRSTGLTLQHPYFDYVPVWYLKTGVELFGYKTHLEKAPSAPGSLDWHYKLLLDKPVQDT